MLLLCSQLSQLQRVLLDPVLAVLLPALLINKGPFAVGNHRPLAVAAAVALAVDDDVEPGRVLLVLGHLGEVQRLQLREHADHR